MRKNDQVVIKEAGLEKIGRICDTSRKGKLKAEQVFKEDIFFCESCRIQTTLCNDKVNKVSSDIKVSM